MFLCQQKRNESSSTTKKRWQQFAIAAMAVSVAEFSRKFCRREHFMWKCAQMKTLTMCVCVRTPTMWFDQGQPHFATELTMWATRLTSFWRKFSNSKWIKLCIEEEVHFHTFSLRFGSSRNRLLSHLANGMHRKWNEWKQSDAQFPWQKCGQRRWQCAQNMKRSRKNTFAQNHKPYIDFLFVNQSKESDT